MDEDLEHIKKHIDECFARIKPIISLRELHKYKINITDEEVIIPCLRENISFQLEPLRQRVKALTDLIEAEEKRTERERERIKGGKKQK